MRKAILAGLAVMAMVAPSASALPMATGSDAPGTAEARKQMEVARSITDPDEYLAFVKSLGDYDYDQALSYGDKR
jgi:N-acetyl-beta-hexosaminidase